jgi:proteasome lid subunit RPN8/RPN11
MAKAAKVKVRVSTQPVVVMEAEVARQIRQHARTSMKAEVCGVLIGSAEHERMTVEACIQGINAAQGGAHVTFTQDTWEHIYKIKDKEYPDQKIVGWYHSHPGFGVFLSEHDLFIQENFFSNPQQVAWVYDPHTDEEGCFGWVGAKIEKLAGIRVGYSQSLDPSASAAGANDYEDEEAALNSAVKVGTPQAPGEPLWVRWASLALGYIAAAVLGLALGFVVREWQMRPLTDTLDLLFGCREIGWQSAKCQDALMQLQPRLMAIPPVGLQSAPAQAAPEGSAAQPQNPAPQVSPPPKAQAPAKPEPGTPGEKPPQPPPQAQKGNNGKH